MGVGDGWPHREAGQAEVEHLHVAVVSNDDVLGLDVAMDEARRVRHRQRPGELRADACQDGDVAGGRA